MNLDDLRAKHKPGIDPVPYYEDVPGGIKCLRCGTVFIGIHVCQRSNF